MVNWSNRFRCWSELFLNFYSMKETEESKSKYKARTKELNLLKRKLAPIVPSVIDDVILVQLDRLLAQEIIPSHISLSYPSLQLVDEQLDEK